MRASLSQFRAATTFFAFVFAATGVFSGSAENKFGHRPSAVVSSSRIVPAGSYRDTGRVVRLLPEAAQAFQEMAKAAKEEGVFLIPISGHRTVEYQKGLFDRAVKRRGSEAAAARWVAPPGHSEHHTGYALDIGDGTRPASEDVELSFENTPAFRWLQKNAERFAFEMSFPKNNPQGVGYEPWHWRYVGSPQTKKNIR